MSAKQISIKNSSELIEALNENTKQNKELTKQNQELTKMLKLLNSKISLLGSWNPFKKKGND